MFVLLIPESLVLNVTANSNRQIPISNTGKKNLNLPKYQISHFLFHSHCTTAECSNALTVD